MLAKAMWSACLRHSEAFCTFRAKSSFFLCFSKLHVQVVVDWSRLICRRACSFQFFACLSCVAVSFGLGSCHVQVSLVPGCDNCFVLPLPLHERSVTSCMIFVIGTDFGTIGWLICW